MNERDVEVETSNRSIVRAVCIRVPGHTTVKRRDVAYGDVLKTLGRSSAVWIVAILLISTTVAIYSFAEASHGFDSFIAETDARKTARQTLVTILDEEVALRLYATNGDSEAAAAYRRAKGLAGRLTRDLRRDVVAQRVPRTATALGGFERSNARLDVALDTFMQRKPGAKFRLPATVYRSLQTSRHNLSVLVNLFNASSAETVKATKARILFGGIVSVGSTCLFGAAALLMETFRRRVQRRRTAEIETNIVERGRAEAASIRADTLEAGKVVLEREIAERTRAERKLAFTAFHDELTGLPNRALFMDRLKHMVARLQRRNDHLSAVLFLDLDRFKVVNDSLGHIVGDLLLVAVARRLEACLRPGDTLARLGGDEFTILLDDIDDNEAACAIAERVLRALDLPFSLSGHEVFATASIGIAVSRTGFDMPEDVLRNADIAMYRAKERGKQRYEVFTPELLARVVDLLEVQTDLQRALERGELRLFYQPIVSLPSRRISGFEALVRWQHPRRGLLGPNDFIGVAEDTGAIVAIGEWVLVTACRQVRAWRDALSDEDVQMNVNVSAKQFAVPRFAELVSSVLARFELTPGTLNLEITESVIMENPTTARATLQTLRDIGVGVHLDDFGTGYSSFAYLHSFPISALKIDRSFVSVAGIDLANPQIVATIIALARSLFIDIVVEGVETEQQLEHLLQLHCTSAQGYLFSHPLTAAAASVQLRSQSRESAVWRRKDDAALGSQSSPYGNRASPIV